MVRPESATVKKNRNYFFDENEWLVAIKFATGANTYFSDDLKLYINEVQNDITYSDKTDDSDCVITYHRFSETEVEVADKGEIFRYRQQDGMRNNLQGRA